VCLTTAAQTSYVHYTVKDGLPQMQCMVLFQDSQGYIWIGTKGGVSRYDGINFVNFSVNEGLPDARIIAINEDLNGKVWVLTSSGLSMFNGRSFDFYPPGDKLNFNKPFIVFDNDSNIWMEDGVFKNRLVKFSKGRYEIVDIPGEENAVRIFGLMFDRKNNTLLFSVIKGRNTKLYSLQNNKFSFREYKDRQISLYHRSGLLVARNLHTKTSPGSFSLMSYSNGKLYEIFRDNVYIDKPLQINDSTYLFTTFNFQSNMPLHRVVNGKLMKEPLRFDQLNDMLQDNENNIWVATEKGLYRITPFKNYSEKDGMPDYVWTIQEDAKGRIWFAPFNDAHLYYLERTGIKKYPQKFETGGFYFGSIRTKNGNILFPYRIGVVVYDNKSFYQMDLPVENATLSLFEDTVSSKLYIGNYKGLVIKDEKNRFEVNKRFTKKREDIILSMVMNKKGELWFVTRSTFGILNRTDTLVMHNDTIKGAMTMMCDNKNNLWIGTNNGLFLYDYKHFIIIDHPELKTMIGSVKSIDSDHFVYGGLRGIGIFDLKKFYSEYNDLTGLQKIDAERFVNYYTRSHGFLGEETGQVGIFKDSKGRVWVPTNNNVVMFNPADLTRNIKSPKVHITNLMSSKDNINWKTEPEVEAVLSHESSNIRIEFIGISLTAPDMVKYKYRLTGFSDEWSNETKERYVTYTNLPPGNYTFELLACNNNNFWTTAPETRDFSIIPAWWQTMWFKVLSVILEVLIVVLIIFFFYHRRLRKKQLDEKLYNLQLQSMQSQLYPHLLFNMASAAGAVIFKENKEKAYDFVVKISKFMRQALEYSRRMYKSIAEELSFVETYLELQKTRFPERFSYEINVSEEVDLAIRVPQMTIQTYVENAVKHGLEPLKGGGKLKVDISKEGDKIIIKIVDNGVGIEEARKHKENGTGRGIRVMNEIFEIHNQRNRNKISYELIDLYQQGKKGTVSMIEIKI